MSISETVATDVNSNPQKDIFEITDNDISNLISQTSSIDLNDSEFDSEITEKSTKFSHENDAFLENTPILHHVQSPDIFSSPVQVSTSKLKKSLWRKEVSGRQRRFGSSCQGHSYVKLSKITKQHKISPKSRLLRTCRKNCKVFSTRVTPCPSPVTASHIFRLSGISMSPSTPIAWISQSPVELGSFISISSYSSNRSPNQFQTSPENSSAKSVDTTRSSQRLQVSDDSCPPDKLYHWKDDVSELVTDDRLGSGGFGQVFEGTYRGTKVAIKKIKNEFKQKNAIFENFIGEVMSLRLSHPNLVRSLVVVQPPNSPLTPGMKGASFLVMEYAGNKNLLQIINDANEVITQLRQLKFCTDILEGLCYLHDRGLAHLDLKPGNVILTANNTCKICDFGSCKLVEVTSKTQQTLALSSSSSSFNTSSLSPSTGGSSFSYPSSMNLKKELKSLLMGTLMYRAPELLKGAQPTTEADMFSFAVTAWQIWQRTFPYPGLHQHTAVYMIVAIGRRPLIPNDVSNDFDSKYAAIIKDCWHSNPIERPTSSDVLEQFKALTITL